MEKVKQPYTKGIIGLYQDGSVVSFHEGAVNEVTGRASHFKVFLDRSGMIRYEVGRGSSYPDAKDVIQAILEVTNRISPSTADVFDETSKSGVKYKCRAFRAT